MLYTKEQVVNGLNNWVDEEIIPRLPTSGKWIIGTAVGLAMSNADAVLSNGSLKVLGIVNADGLIDADKLCSELKHSADRYGKLTVSFPFIGTMAFGPEDIENARRHIV